MMKPTKLFCVLIIALTVSSCAFHSGMMNDSTSLHGQDFELIGLAIGQAKVTRVFGFGGLNPIGLTNEARRDMHNRFPLKKGQVYANTSVDMKRSFFPFVGTTLVTITADIVQFGEEEENGELQKVFEKVEKPQAQTFMNDSTESAIMIYGELKRINILALTRNDRYTVKDMQGVAYEGIRKSEIFRTTPGYISTDRRFKVGDKVSFKEAPYINSGMVIGIAEKKVAIQTDLLIIQVSPENVIEVIE